LLPHTRFLLWSLIYYFKNWVSKFCLLLATTIYELYLITILNVLHYLNILLDFLLDYLGLLSF
jgi:hypothetical protein